MMLRVSGSDSHVRDHFQQQVVAVEFIMIIKCACNHEDTAMQSRGPRCNHDKMACTSVSLLKSACSVKQLYATQQINFAEHKTTICTACCCAERDTWVVYQVAHSYVETRTSRRSCVTRQNHYKTVFSLLLLLTLCYISLNS